MKIVAVIPAYNEETRIASVIRAAFTFVSAVIVVDDGSQDRTAEVARDAGAIVLVHPENSGSGAATMTGVEAARHMHSDIIVTLDADGQHDPRISPPC